MLIAGLLAVITYSSVIVYYLDYITAIMNTNNIVAFFVFAGLILSIFCVWKIAAVLTGVIILKRKTPCWIDNQQTFRCKQKYLPQFFLSPNFLYNPKYIFFTFFNSWLIAGIDISKQGRIESEVIKESHKLPNRAG